MGLGGLSIGFIQRVETGPGRAKKPRTKSVRASKNLYHGVKSTFRRKYSGCTRIRLQEDRAGFSAFETFSSNQGHVLLNQHIDIGLEGGDPTGVYRLRVDIIADTRRI